MSVITRSLGLLGLVVLMVFMAAGGWAADGDVLNEIVKSGDSIPPMSYPYLSPDPAQRDFLINAFKFQSAVFAGIGGIGATAFQYLAMMAALVGALMIVFFSKYQKTPIVAPWLLLVVIIVFSPYGSKILFQPVKGEDSSLNCLESGNQTKCGFAPQLVGIHLASTAQVLISDTFRSVGWHGIIEELMADSKLKGQALFVVDDSWYQAADQYKADGCGNTSFSQANATPSTGTPAAPPKEPFITFEDWWTKRQDSVVASVNSGKGSAPPPLMVLYDESDTDFMNRLKADEAATRNYQSGIDALYKAYGGQKNVVLNAPSNATTAITVAAALDELASNDFFKVQDFSGLLPGYFFVRGKDVSTIQTTTGIDEAAPQLKARSCYKSISPPNSTTAMMAPADTMCNFVDSAWSTVSQKDLINDIEQVRENGDLSKLSNKTNVMFKPLVGAFSQLKDMPVGNLPIGATGGANAPATGNVGKVIEGRNCEASAKKLVADGLSQSLGKLQNDPFEKYIKMIKNEEEIPYPLTVSALISDNADVYSRKLAQAFVESLNPKILAKGGTSASKEDKQALALEQVISLIYTNGRRTTENPTGEVEKNASRDGATVEVVGSSLLTSLGGGAAMFFGKLLVNVGSIFTGPLAQAVVGFVSILVDMALLALIVVTPFMFLAGVFMPGSAIGVLITCCLGVFILKFVPVTLVILNNIGGLIYSVLGVSGSPVAETMQAMLIMAMSGVYMSIVGMTFFMLFKLGDSAAILGRFTALDGAAKQIADRGMGAAILAATTAATLATGGIAAGLGHRSLSKAARKAEDELGVPDGAMGIIEEQTKDGIPKDGDPNFVEPSQLAKPGEEGFIDPLSEAGEQQAREQEYDLDPQKLGLEDQMRNNKFDDDDIASFRSNGFLDKDGWTYTKDAETGLLKSSKMSQRDGFVGPLANGKIGMSSDIMGNKQLTAAETADAEGKLIAGLGSVDPATLAATSEAAGQANGVPVPSAEGTIPPVAGGVSGAGGTGTMAQGTGPIQVSVVDGKLSTVGEVGNIQALAESSSVQGRAKDLEEQALAQRMVSANARMDKIAEGSSDETKGKTEAFKDRYMNAKSQAEMDAIDRDISRDSSLISNERDKNAKENYTRNMNDQLASEIARVNTQIASGKLSPDAMKHNQAYKERLEKIDPVALTQGELMAKMGSMEEMKKAMDIRGAADNMPGFWQTVGSGIYGAGSGGKGALGKIPIIGPAISEATNEYYQAPERARAWNAVGGRKEFKQLQADAQRMGFYQKEMAPIAAGTQYQSMVAVGAFQAQADLARQTASEAVAKSRSQYEAMVINTQATRGGSPESKEFRNYMTVGELSGLGRMDAADRVASVRQEAFMMQGESMLVKRAVIKGTNESALDANMQIKLKSDGTPIDFEIKDTKAVLTAQSLHQFRGDLTTKKLANNFDEMMIAHYGLAEKQYLRGNNDWDSTRSMNSSSKAAATFARKDVDTNYLIGGHLKMVEGKLKFKDVEGQYNKLVEFRGDENRIKAAFIQDAMKVHGGMDGVLKAAAAAGKYEIDKETGLVGAQIQTYRREALDKYATDVLKKSGALLKMEAIFDEAGSVGTTKYEEKAWIAPARDATRLSKLNDSINKEYAKMWEIAPTFAAEAWKDTTIHSRNGGASGKIDSLTKSMTEAFTSKLEKDNLGSAFTAISKSIREVPNSSVSITRNVQYTDMNGDKRQMVYAANGLTEAAYLKTEKDNPSLLSLLRSTFTKDRNLETGGVFYRRTSLAIDDSNGAKIENIDANNMIVVSSKKGKNGNSN